MKVLFILVANGFLANAALSSGLEPGRYETVAAACSFNVEPMGGH
jgi:hypothetical protein